MPTAVPVSDTIPGTWSPSTGGSLFGTIDEGVASDADYDSSTSSPLQADFFEVKLGALSDPLSSVGHVVGYRYKKNASSGDQINLKVRLVQGNTVIATWTHLNIDAVTTASQTLSNAQADAITNYSDLRLRFEAWRQPDAPVAPATANYTIPVGAVSVSTQSALETAIAGASQDIVIENGSYVRSGPLSIGNKRLWARTFGGVTMNYGISIGGSVGGGGGEIHGLTLNVASNSQAPAGAIVLVSGSAGGNTAISDVAITGSTSLTDGTDGIRCTTPNGFSCKRVTISTVTGNGVTADDGNISSAAVITEISDINVNGAKYAIAGTSVGASEAGLWIGHRISGNATRYLIRNVGWSGIATGNIATNFTVSNFDIDAVSIAGSSGGYGVFCRNQSRLITFDTYYIGDSVPIGFWEAGDYGQAYGLSSQITLPTATIPVNEATTNAASSGTLYVGNPDGTISTVTYTGKTSNSFTGCSGGTGTYPAGTIVSVGGSVNGVAIPGGPAAYKITIRNGTIAAAVGAGFAVVLDTGAMLPSIFNTSFVRALSGTFIVDKTNNPSVDVGGISNLVQSGNRFVPAEPAVVAQTGKAGFPILLGMS